MTATDELRRLLDESGEKHSDVAGLTLWLKDGNHHNALAIERVDGSISLFLDYLTPRKAIEATICHKSVTPEQVRKIMCNHWHDLSAEYDMPEASALQEYSYDWHAIADELNAELANGRGKCKIISEICSRCGAIIHESANMYWQYLDGGFRTVKHKPANYCPNCGREVEK